MIIPKLDHESRSREYNSYNDEQRRKVVYASLFEGKTHREIDQEVLHLDSDYSRGWQSMGILHYLGLKKNFRGIFSGMTAEQAIAALKDTGDPEYQTLIEILSGIKDETERRIVPEEFVNMDIHNYREFLEKRRVLRRGLFTNSITVWDDNCN